MKVRYPIKTTVTQESITAAREQAGILDQVDQPRSGHVLDEVRRFFGGFTKEAQVRSSFLIDRLVDRS